MKFFLVLLLVFFAAPCIFTQGQDPFSRSNDTRLFTENVLNRLDKATGWIKNDVGEWESAENKIPSKFEIEDGDDNFASLTMSDLRCPGGKTYALLYKKFYYTRYLYPTLHKKPYKDYSTYYWVFEKSELEKLKNLPEGKTIQLEIRLKDNCYLIDKNDGTLIDWYQKYPEDINEPCKDSLVVLVRLSHEKNLVQFLLYYKKFDQDSKGWLIRGAGSLNSKLEADPLKTFDTTYFEISFDAFKTLFRIE